MLYSAIKNLQPSLLNQTPQQPSFPFILYQVLIIDNNILLCKEKKMCIALE